MQDAAQQSGRCRTHNPALAWNWGSKCKKNIVVLLQHLLDVGPFDLCVSLIVVFFFIAVALNFQSLATPMDLNDGRFQDNGGCGYILKPAMLMSSQGHFDPSRSRQNLLVKVS